jgi:Tfp pilus assembly protein PilO
MKLSAPLSRPSAKATGAIVLVVVAALAAAVWLLVVSPKRSEASDLGAQIADVQAQVSALSAQRPQASTTVSPELLKQLEVAMPDAQNMPEIVDELSALAHEAGVTVVTLSPSTEVTGDGYTTVPLSVVVQGRFFALRDFLRRLRTQTAVSASGVTAHGRLFSVESVDLQQTEPAPMVQASMTIDAYRFTGQAAPAPAPAPAADTTTSGT